MTNVTEIKLIFKKVLIRKKECEAEYKGHEAKIYPFTFCSKFLLNML